MRMSGSSLSRKRAAAAMPLADARSAATCRTLAMPLSEREIVAIDAPRATRSAATRCPIPPEPPDSTTLELGNSMPALGTERNAPEDIGEQHEHTLGHVDDRLLVLGMIDAAHQPPEEVHVLDIERTMRGQIFEAVGFQIERPHQGFGPRRRELGAGAFEHEHHAEETDGIDPVDEVVGVGDHEFGRHLGPAAANRVRIAAGIADVVEDPLLVPGFFGDILVKRLIEPLSA